MLKSLLGITLNIGLLASATVAAASAEMSPLQSRACGENHSEISLASQIGSASFMHNLAQHPESIRAIAQKLLEEALNEEDTETPGCTSDCDESKRSEIIYRVSPIDFLSQEKQNSVCSQFEAQTTTSPLEFGPKKFDTIEQLNDWIMDFSQGNGPDGKLLYDQCSSNCSPRYTFLISEGLGRYTVKARVLCGLARDKSNNRYRISTALRRLCIDSDR